MRRTKAANYIMIKAVFSVHAGNVTADLESAFAYKVRNLQLRFAMN